ncbi:hypothetical protein CR970_02900 [Candidatus Saccharibacteria bacterium]|nr:MAG: hypothetical protein CR970_02900 [Candidatus Saccharibacteria bacterium]
MQNKQSPSNSIKKGVVMKKNRILNTPTRVSDVSFEDLYDVGQDRWEQKAAALQARRWRALKRAIKGDRYSV